MNGSPALSLPWLLTGTGFRLDPVAEAFLPFTLLLWLAAGVYGRRYLQNDPRRPLFFLFFLAAMPANLGLILARDMAGFYLFYAVLTLAAYGLIIHLRTAEACRAGRMYIILALIGEMLVLSAILLVAAQAGNADFLGLPAAVAASPHRDLVVALFIAGFGVKLGAFPLHVWLPLAHPVAPSPASAVLSGVIIKAGLLGLIRFLPLGEVSLPGFAGLCLILGAAGSLYGVLAGLTQRDAKTVLAYSSVSQMGILIALLAPALAAPESWPLCLAALCAGSLHHALHKGALFLGTGLIPRIAGHGRTLVEAGLLLSFLALAGAPLTSGSAAKTAAKAALAAGGQPASAAWLLPLSSLATTLLLVHFFMLIRAMPREEALPPARPGLLLPWLVLVLSGLTAGLFPLLPGAAATPLTAGAMAQALWPVLAGLLLARLLGLLQGKFFFGTGFVPPGDLLALPVAGLAALSRTWRRYAARREHRQGEKRMEGRGKEHGRRVSARGQAADRLEDLFSRWRCAGFFLLLLMATLYVLLGSLPS